MDNEVFTEDEKLHMRVKNYCDRIPLLLKERPYSQFDLAAKLCGTTDVSFIDCEIDFAIVCAISELDLKNADVGCVGLVKMYAPNFGFCGPMPLYGAPSKLNNTDYEAMITKIKKKGVPSPHEVVC